MSQLNMAYASDLHLEFNDSLPLTGLDGVDVLVLAGDVDTSPEYYSQLLKKLRIMYAGPVLFVMGNHEYYGHQFPTVIDDYRNAIEWDQNAHILEKQSFVLNDVRFLGTTLWTDFAEGRQMRNCQHMMADYSVIMRSNNSCITPEIILDEHKADIDWLDSMLDGAPDYRANVVITHHAPSFRSQHPRFAGSLMSGGFCSNQERRIQKWKPDIWIHGHVHDSMNYRIGKTRVLCNPWGYAEEGNAREYRLIDV